MITSFSNISNIPFYSNRKDQLFRDCHSCIETVLYPSFDEVKLQLSFKEGYTLLGFSVYDTYDNNYVPDNFTWVNHTIDDLVISELQGIQITGVANCNSYYIRILVDTPNGAIEYFSEAFSISNCLCYRIDFYDSCDSHDFGFFSSGFKNSIYLKETLLETSSIEEIIEELQNGFNSNLEQYRSITDVTSFSTIGSKTLIRSLSNADRYECIDIVDLESNDKASFQSIEVSGSGLCVFPITVSLQSKETRDKKTNCCTSSYSEAPYDECPTDTNDPPCPSDYSVTFEPDGNGNVVAVVSNAPNSVTYQIIRNGQVIGTGSSINLTAYGTYEVRAISDGCIATDQYIYENPCNGFSVGLVLAGMVIDGVVTLPSGQNVTITITDSSGNTVGNSFPTTVASNGDYIVKVETESCSSIRTINVTEDTCEIAFEIVKTGDQLSIQNVTGCDTTPLFQWFKVTAGSNQLLVSSQSTVTADETAYYIAKVTCGACSESKGYMCVIDADCIPIEIKNWDEMPVASNPPLIVNVTCGTCDDDCNGTLTIDCIKNPDGSIELCSTFSKPGYTFEICDQNNNPLGTGEKFTIPDQTATYIIKATNPDCPTLTQSYTYIKPNAGQGNSPSNPVIV